MPWQCLHWRSMMHKFVHGQSRPVADVRYHGTPSCHGDGACVQVSMYLLHLYLVCFGCAVLPRYPIAQFFYILIGP